MKHTTGTFETGVLLAAEQFLLRRPYPEEPVLRQSKYVVVVGSRLDPHVSRVVDRLNEFADLSICVVDPAHPIKLSITSDVAGEPGLSIGDWRFEPTSGGSLVCWWRDKTRHRVVDSEESQAWVWAWGERRAFLAQALSSVGARFINDPGARRPAHDKLLQLKAAREIGFLCPPTLITSDKQRAAEFLRVNEPAIVKPLATPVMPGSTRFGFDTVSIPVARISAAEILEEPDEDFEAAPMIIQPEIKKSHEVRSVAFGRRLRSFKIDSQVSKRGELDWRRASGEDIFSVFETPARIVDLCGAYLSHVGLVAGSFDFVVDDLGRWWFLECNPEGQWAWLEGDDHEISSLYASGIVEILGGSDKRTAPTTEGHERFVPAHDLIEHLSAQRRAVYFLSLKNCPPCSQINQHLSCLDNYALDGFTVFGTLIDPADGNSREAMLQLGVKSFPMAILVNEGIPRLLRCSMISESLRFSDPATNLTSSHLRDFVRQPH